ncbi:hypothetical protein CBS101457_005262 [Exobasidium rhododendri]|nr:hypothetical protein CBS101457_005262 [Exobasidium rhododendri]
MATSAQDYTVAPLALLDTTKGNTDIVVQLSLSFSERLSFEVLEETWYQLVSAWPIVSARIRNSTTSPSGLEYQIPSQDRLEEIRRNAHHIEPLKRQFYCLDEGSRDISSYSPGMGHGVASPVQQSRTFTAIGPTKEEEKRITAANATSTFQEYLTNDVPLLTAQVTRFAHDTMISVTFSHVIGDGFSVKNTLKAWEGIIHGRGPPPPLEDLGSDPFQPFDPEEIKKASSSSSSAVEKNKRATLPIGFHYYSFLEKLEFMKNYLYDLYIRRPESKIQQRYVFLPRHEVEALEAQVKQDLEAKASRENRTMGKTDQVGKSDMLYAWLMKHSHVGVARSAYSTPLTIVNVRGKKPSGMIEPLPQHSFWGAAFPIPLDSLQVGKLLDMPIGELALHVRHSIAKNGSAENAKTTLIFDLHHNLWKNKEKKSSDFPFFCPSHHRWSGISDWRAVTLFDVDMGPARESGSLPPSEDKTKAVLVKVVNAQMSADMSKRDRWVCVGDSVDGTWFTGFLSQDQWSDKQGFGKYDQYLHGGQVKSRPSRL